MVVLETDIISEILDVIHSAKCMGLKDIQEVRIPVGRLSEFRQECERRCGTNWSGFLGVVTFHGSEIKETPASFIWVS